MIDLNIVWKLLCIVSNTFSWSKKYFQNYDINMYIIENLLALLPIVRL